MTPHSPQRSFSRAILSQFSACEGEKKEQQSIEFVRSTEYSNGRLLHLLSIAHRQICVKQKPKLENATTISRAAECVGDATERTGQIR